MLELVSLSKRFGATRAVDNVSLVVKDGELVVLLGPSGCGKTTTMRLIAGLEKPDQGTIVIDGIDFTEVAPQQRNVAMVFQQYALYPHRSVRENIDYPLRVRGLSGDIRRQKVERVSSLLGIAALLDRKPRELSGGEAQRVALARALVREPRCFLLDEPLSSVDPQIRARARAEIKRLHGELKVTTLYVTHDQQDALSLGDRIAIMKDGRIVQVGSADDVYNRPANVFVATFLGSPEMNLLAAQVRRGDDVVGVVLEADDRGHVVSGFQFNASQTGLKLIVGFRSGDVAVIADQGASVPTSQEWIVKGNVLLVEGVRDDYLVHCDSGYGQIIARTRVKPGEGQITLGLNAVRAYYFDARSGARIDPPTSG